jgi:hypothetical protein
MTVIEWLVKQLDIDLVDSDWYIEKAKEMEKQEKHAEYMRGWKDGYSKNDPK